MSIRYSIRDKTWFFRFKLNGEDFFKQGFKSEKEARDDESKTRASALAGAKKPSVDIRSLPFGTACQQFYDEHSVNLASEPNHRARLPILCDFFKGKKFIMVTKDDARACLEWIKLGKNVSDHTINHYRALGAAVYNWWIEEKDANVTNPFERVKPKVVSRARTRIMYPAEEKLITPAVFANRKLWPYYLTALLTGLRLTNVVNIRVRDVDLIMDHIFVPLSKNGRSGYIPIPPDLRPWLQKWMRGKRQDDRVLGDFSHRSWVSTQFRWLVNKLEIGDLTFHDLRHTFAWFHLRRGEHLYKVSKLLLHRSQQTTEEHYGHFQPADMKPGADLPQSLVSMGFLLRDGLQQTVQQDGDGIAAEKKND